MLCIVFSAKGASIHLSPFSRSVLAQKRLKLTRKIIEVAEFSQQNENHVATKYYFAIHDFYFTTAKLFMLNRDFSAATCEIGVTLIGKVLFQKRSKTAACSELLLSDVLLGPGNWNCMGITSQKKE